MPQSYAINIQNGENLIASQLDHGSNTLNEIIPSAPAFSTLYKYDNTRTNWISAYYNAGIGSWVPNSITLNPGEGAILQSPTRFNLTFTGRPHVPVLPVTIPSGQAY